MQTFLPYESFSESAKVLDRLRLGKQRVEVLQIFETNNFQLKAWSSHPATKMWKGYEKALLLYGIIICQEWRRRGYRDQMLNRCVAYWEHLDARKNQLVYPPWLGNVKFHLSHQSNLLRKDYTHYSQYFPNIPTNMKYVWP